MTERKGKDDERRSEETVRERNRTDQQKRVRGHVGRKEGERFMKKKEGGGWEHELNGREGDWKRVEKS